MTDSACEIICLVKIKEEMKFDFDNKSTPKLEHSSSEEAVSNTRENSCKKEIDKVYVHNELAQPHTIKEEDSIKIEEVVDDKRVLFNTDLPSIIEERIPINILLCHLCNYGTNDKQNLTDHIFKHRLKCNHCDYTTLCNHTLTTHQQIHMRNVHDIKYSVADVSTNEKSLLQTGEELVFQCHDCGYRARSKILLILHTETCLKGRKTPLKKKLGRIRTCTGEKLFKCDLCDYRNKHSGNFKTHMLKHSNDCPFSCDKCGYKTHYEFALARHKTIHLKLKTVKCDLCDYNCKRSDYFKRHMNKHLRGLNFICDKCDYKTYCESKLIRHTIVHSDEKPFKCVSCDFTSKRSDDLKQHSNKHSGELNFKCDKCDYKSYSKKLLARHKIIHSDEKPFKCDSCDYTTKRSILLKTHSNVHSGEVNFSCDKCYYKTYTKTALAKHKAVHLNVFKCDLCDYSCKRSVNFEQHAKKHSDEFNFNCDKCDYKTYYKWKLTKHMIAHSKERPFKCSLCDFTSKRSNNLRVHLSKHGECNFSCDKCEYKTYSKRLLARHTTVHSEEKPFRCSLCDYTSKYSSNLKVHLINHGLSNSNLTRHRKVHSKQKQKVKSEDTLSTNYTGWINNKYICAKTTFEK